MNESELIALAEKAVKLCKDNNLTLATAESCTGGYLGKLITDISGASAIYPGGICTYSNDMKIKFLGVNPETLKSFGAVSEQTAYEMAEGVRKAFSSDIGIGITGIAGPESDDTKKPVGLIYIGISDKYSTDVTELKNKFTDCVREQNRKSAVKAALTLIGNRYEETKE